MSERAVTQGVLRRHRFASRYVDARPVEVWCPPGYEEGDQRFPVLYMHDGQNLFDPEESFIGVDWGVDETMIRLMDAGEIRGAIVVAVWNTPKRWREYMPQKHALASWRRLVGAQLARKVRGLPISNCYLKFLVEEVKPFVDAEYRTLADRANTLVMGSSMGGLISLYAVEEYPDVFGAAGCVSTHWPAGGNPLVDAMADALPHAADHRLYFDYGTETIDAEYEPYQRRMDVRLAAAGYVLGDDWVTEKFTGAEHSERAWRDRLHVPLRFLLGASEEAILHFAS